MSPWRALVELVGAMLAPERCAACDAAVRWSTVFCAPCALTLVRAPAQDPALLAPFLYGGALAQAITRLKYEGRADLARPLASVLVRAVAVLEGSPPDVVVPVPLHASRLAARGFNQAALLAAPIARAFGVPLSARALSRTRDTAHQARLDRNARLTNLRDAFEIRTVARLDGKRVLLVDDVRTTGATLRACTAALRAGGVREVVCAVVARAE